MKFSLQCNELLLLKLHISYTSIFRVSFCCYVNYNSYLCSFILKVLCIGYRENTLDVRPVAVLVEAVVVVVGNGCSCGCGGCSEV